MCLCCPPYVPHALSIPSSSVGSHEKVWCVVQIVMLPSMQFYPACFTSFQPEISSSAPYSLTPSRCPFLIGRDQVSVPYKTTGKTVAPYILIFVCRASLKIGHDHFQIAICSHPASYPVISDSSSLVQPASEEKLLEALSWFSESGTYRVGPSFWRNSHQSQLNVKPQGWARPQPQPTLLHLELNPTYPLGSHRLWLTSSVWNATTFHCISRPKTEKEVVKSLCGLCMCPVQFSF
jgi:hypothetical protein